MYRKLKSAIRFLSTWIRISESCFLKKLSMIHAKYGNILTFQGNWINEFVNVSKSSILSVIAALLEQYLFFQQNYRILDSIMDFSLWASRKLDLKCHNSSDGAITCFKQNYRILYSIMDIPLCTSRKLNFRCHSNTDGAITFFQ